MAVEEVVAKVQGQVSEGSSVEKAGPDSVKEMLDEVVNEGTTDQEDSGKSSKQKVNEDPKDSKDETVSPTEEDSAESSKIKDEAKDGDDKGDSKKEEASKEEAKKKALPRGMKAQVKDLWAKTDAQCKCCTTWVDEVQDNGNNIEESDECMQHAIVVRRKRKHEGNRKPLKIDSIVIHSYLIKKVLQTIFSGYPDLVIDLEELIFDAPFSPFFFRWEAFVKAVEAEQDDITKSHLELLHKVLAKELEQPLQRQSDLLRHKAIDFELLWTLFVPGALLYSHDDNEDRLYEIGDCEYWSDGGVLKFTVRCEMIDWDGEKFGKTTLSETLSRFKGTRKITSLPSYPLRFHQNPEEMKRKCIERGKRFRQLAGVSCKDYKGTGIEYTKYSFKTVKTKRHVEGRIMLDEELFQKMNPDETGCIRDMGEDEDDIRKSEAEAMTRLTEQTVKARKALQKALDEEKKAKEAAEKDDAEKKSDDKQFAAQDNKAEVVVASEDTKSSVETPADTVKSASSVAESSGKAKETSGDLQPANTVANQSGDTSQSSSEGIPTPQSESSSDPESEVQIKSYSRSEKQELNEHQLAICNSWLRGYSLTSQKWTSFSVKNIADVVWNNDAFQQLTLPSEYRALILATIKSQIRQNKWKQKMEKAEKEQKPLESLSMKRERTDESDSDSDSDDVDDPAQFDDFIAQKGLGYIMLFSGSPGVGKTATAEAIAELLHVPLCTVSAGNLGTSADTVETALQDILELSSKWNGVLLLDEADIWLEQRKSSEIHRNSVVSVFLRMLEYYQGVLCLTTNRSADIDVAFHSRIHLSLPFPDLTENNREQIWRRFASITNKRHQINTARRKALDNQASTGDSNSAEQEASNETVSETNGDKKAELKQQETNDECALVDLSAADFRKLSQTNLNGRQVKNTFKTALLLASYSKEKLQLKHIKTALKTIDLGKCESGRMYY